MSLLLSPTQLATYQRCPAEHDLRYRRCDPHRDEPCDLHGDALRGVLTGLMRMHPPARYRLLERLSGPTTGPLGSRPRLDLDRTPVGDTRDEGADGELNLTALGWLLTRGWLDGTPVAVEARLSLLTPAGDGIVGVLGRIDESADGLHVIDYDFGRSAPQELVAAPDAGAAWLASQPAAPIHALLAGGTLSRPVAAVTRLYPLCGLAVTWHPEPEELDRAAVRLVEQIAAIKTGAGSPSRVCGCGSGIRPEEADHCPPGAAVLI